MIGVDKNASPDRVSGRSWTKQRGCAMRMVVGFLVGLLVALGTATAWHRPTGATPVEKQDEHAVPAEKLRPVVEAIKTGDTQAIVEVLRRADIITAEHRARTEQMLLTLRTAYFTEYGKPLGEVEFVRK